MHRWIARNIYGRSLDLSRGTRTMDCRRGLEISQWWPEEKILDLQSERLQKLIRYAYDNVPYYQRLFTERGLKPGDIKSRLDLVKLPVLTKKIIRGNSSLLLAPNFPRKQLVSASTSGSTGEPLAFYSTVDDQMNWGFARGARAQSWSGYEKGDKIFRFDAKLKNKTTLEKWRNALNKSLGRIMLFNTQDLSVESVQYIVRNLEKFQPGFLQGYPSAVYLLALHIQGQGVTNLHLKAVLTGGEQIFDYQRELFRNVFKCETFSYYSSWEVNSIAGECAQHTGLHVPAENVIMEIGDQSGNPVPPEKEGRILLTNLHNYGMPFIRYDIGDTGALSASGCPCGRAGLPLLVKLNGRADAILLTRSGKSIPGRGIPQRFLANLGVEQYQIVQESYEEIVMRLVLSKDCPEEHKDKIIHEVNAFYQPLLGNEVAVKVQFEPDIPPAKTGKREIFISKLPH